MIAAMFRTSSTEAVVLRKVRVGEIHKSLTLLSPTLGLIGVMAHGAYKIHSRLRTASEPFGVIRAYLYHEPVKDQYKITDIEAIDTLEGIRHSVLRFFTASLWAEVCLKSFGGGEGFAGLYELLREALGLLADCPEASVDRLSVQFLVRFLELMGHRPNLEHCSACGVELELRGGAYLSEEAGLLCPLCGHPERPHLPGGALRYLQATARLPLAQAARVGLEAGALEAAKEAIYALTRRSIEADLNAVRCSAGIL
jgi:DNA repair protein RecO (recombination protein O)